MEKVFKNSYSQVFDKCIEALMELNMNIKSRSNGLIQASTSTSLLSWGETIEIKIQKMDIKTTKVAVESDASAQLFTWGKNSENEIRIIECLTRKL